MTVTNYTWLSASLRRRINRTDLSGDVDDFIALAEARFNRVIRHPEMLSVETELDISGEFTALPADFVAAETIVAVASGRRQPLSQMPSAVIARWFDGSAGSSVVFSIRGKQLQVEPPPDSGLAVMMTYYQKIPTIAGNANGGTNWLIADHPDIYLYGTLFEAALLMQDDERQQDYADRAKAAIDELGFQADDWSIGPAPSVQMG